MLRQAIFAHKPQVFLRRVQKGRDPFVPDRVKPALASLEKGDQYTGLVFLPRK